MFFKVQHCLPLLLMAICHPAYAGKTPPNAPPVVTLTSPATGASFAAPATITLTASASDSNGTVTKVDFYNGTTLLKSVTTAPYTFTWANVAANSYVLSAKATDNGGATATSATANVTVAQGGDISITSPVAGNVYNNNTGGIWVEGSYSGPADATIAVSNGENSTVLATRSGSTFTAADVQVGPGPYTLTAKAVRRDGVTSTASVNVVMLHNPLLVVTAPLAGSQYRTPINLNLEASAVAKVSTIKEVSFYKQNGTFMKIGTATAPPYTVVWNNVPKGYHLITAAVTDNLGNYRSSLEIPINVLGPNAPPAVSWTAPAAGASYAAPATVPLAASATDSDGAVRQLEFLLDGAVVATTNIAPFSHTLFNLPPGNYVLAARATDNEDAVTLSEPVTILVGQPAGISLATPGPNSSFSSLMSIPLAVALSPAPGTTLLKVEYFDGATPIGTAVEAPFSFTWTNAPGGTHQISAKVTDSRGIVASTVPVAVSVLALPLDAVFDTPAMNSSYQIPAPVPVAVRARSVNGDIAKLELYDGATLLATVTPPAQINALSYDYTWYPSEAGARKLSVKLLGSTGATFTSAERLVNVQGPALPPDPPEPPPAPYLVPTSPGQFYVGPAGIDLYALNGVMPAGTVISKVEYFDGATLIGTVEAKPFSLRWNNVPVGTHSVTLKATDSTGKTSVSAPYLLIVGAAVSVTPAAGLNNSTVQSDVVHISGTFQAPPNSAVSVNGKLAMTTADGKFVVNNVSLVPGSNVLTVSVNTIDGQTADSVLNITSAAPAPFAFGELAGEGFAPFKASFVATQVGTAPVTKIELLCRDDGFVFMTGTALSDLSRYDCAYDAPGLYRARLNVYTLPAAGGTEELAFTGTLSVNAQDVRHIDRVLRTLYNHMTARLKVGNIDGATNVLTAGAYPRMLTIFNAIGTNWATVADELGTIAGGSISSEMAEYTLTRRDEGVLEAFSIRLIMSEDGIWRIDGM
jgi:hypothetical protein